MNLKKKLAQVGITRIFTIIGIMLMTCFVLYSGVVGAEEIEPTITHTITTDTTCIDGVCNKILYSGVRNVYEDEIWKRIEDAKSLKNKGFDIVYLENDGTHKIEVIDFNMSYLELNFSYDKDSLGKYESEIEIEENKSKMKTKYKIIETLYNKTTGEPYEIKTEQEIEIEEDERSNFIYQGNPFGKEFHLGENSTTIKLQEADTENLEDVELSYDMLYDQDSIMIKFNITSVPADVTIVDATLALYLYQDFNNDEDVNITRIPSQTWTEGDSVASLNSTWAGRTDSDSSQTLSGGSEVWNTLNITSIVQTEYGDSNDAVSIGLEDPDYPMLNVDGKGLGSSADMIEFGRDGGAISGAQHLYYSKEYVTDTSLRPYLNITYSESGDETPPYFTTIPANTTINYTQGFGVDFDAEDETEFDSYAINWTTLFQINQSGWLENSTANIAVGIYLINVTINDSSNNLNSTIYKVTINKATTSLGITGTTPITYGTTTNVAGTDCPSQLSCSLDKANAVYGVGTETFNYSTAGNENYTSDYITKGIVINKATLSGSLTNTDTWTEPYLESVTIGLSESNTGDGDVTYIVYRDGVNKTTGETVTLGVGTYDYVLNSTGGTNYSTIANMDSQTLTVSQIASQTSLTFSLDSPQTYGTAITPTCSVTTGEGSAVLRQDGTIITSGVAITLGADTYSFNCSMAETQNYTSSENVSSYTINKATPSTDITWTSPITYGTASDALGVETNDGDGNVVYNLYREDSPGSGNYVSVSNPDNTVLGVGAWSYRFEALEGANYSQLNLTLGSLTVNQVSSSINLTLNDIQGNASINEDTSINLNCSTISGDSSATLKLYNNGTLINSGISPLGNYTLFSDPGDYNITCIYENTQNYTTSTTTFWLEVNDTTAPVVSIYYQWNSTNDAVDFGTWTEGFVSINWNLTDTSGINTSTCQIKVRNKDIATNNTNLSYIDDLIHPDYDSAGYKNLTCYTEDLGGVTRISANMTRSYEWRPLITALDQDNSSHDNAYYSHGGKSTKITFHNITNTINTTFIFLADVVNQSGTVADLLFYSCNSSYTTGDFTTSPFCSLVGAASPDSARDVNFNYLIGALETDENGMFGGVIHTETMYGISYCPSCTNTGNSWITYSTNGYDGHSSTSSNQGSHWTDLSGEEFNVILHVIDNTQLEFNLTIEDNVGNELSVLQTDNYGALANLAPFGDIQTDNITGSLVSYYDIHGVTESGTIWINVTVSDPNADDVNCSIYLLNNDSSANQTLLANYSISGYGICSYEWNTSTIPDGDYRLNVTAFDGSLTGYDESAGYIKINAIPIITKISPVTNIVTTSLTQTYSYNISDNDNITKCSLLMDGLIVANDTSINKSETNSFTYTQSVGTYVWSIQCDDEYSNTGSSGNFSIQFYVEYGGGGGSSYSYYSQCYKVVNNECKYRALYDVPCPDDYFTSLDLCESSLEIEEVEPTVAEKIMKAVKEIIDLDKVEDIEKKDTFLIVILALSFGGILWYGISWYNNPKRKKVKLLYR